MPKVKTSGSEVIHFSKFDEPRYTLCGKRVRVVLEDPYDLDPVTCKTCERIHWAYMRPNSGPAAGTDIMKVEGDYRVIIFETSRAPEQGYYRWVIEQYAPEIDEWIPIEKSHSYATVDRAIFQAFIRFSDFVDGD